MLYPKVNDCRDLIQLDGFWKFKKDTHNIGECESWQQGLHEFREIAVPASWNEQYSDLFEFYGKGWYEKKVFISRSWSYKAIWLRIGSACYKSKVWINGKYAGEHEGGHLPFEFNISEFVVLGMENLITIMVDASLDPWSLPPAALLNNEGRVGFFNSNPPVTYDFFPYGGIHRPVYLYCTNKNRIEDITIITDVYNNTGRIKYSVNLSRKSTGTLKVCTDNKIFEHSIKDSDLVDGYVEIQSVRLWDIGKPNLYKLDVTLIENDEITDNYSVEYGVRTIKIEDNKLVINDREVFLKGFGKHEDFHIIGKGLNHSLIVKDFDLMNWVGANSFRTSHYPYSEEIMEYADRTGFLIIDETPFVGLNERMYRDDILAKAKKVITELIKRDKNHPSVIMWSLANEPNVNTEEGEKFFCEMLKTAKELDSTRPITYVAHLEPENNIGMEKYDVVCINKYYGWYINPGEIEGTLPLLDECMDRFYEAFHKPIIVAEFGADAIAGMHHEPAQMFSEEYQSEIIEKQYNLIKSKEYCIGAHVWAFADFKTAQSISRIIYNRKGVFTRERYPKLAAHKLKEIWKKKL